ncbi:hypothetical protein FHL15_003540 [Xylaria flabelliformis]|uniref:Uncharacterized protein n=1 Tax=Xylaria flabelliformis TaxID=2512241 RepID=A0A553I5V2_9PEZI|nr:hypothetical protein FHL15_003540 [Xylaria flabelliformis]
MAQYLSLHRTSFTSLEDDGFFSAFSSQPTSRLMSVFASQEHDQLAEDANSIKRPSEPLVSVCLPLAESMPPSSRGESPGLRSLADPHDNFPKHHRFDTTSHRHQSTQPMGRKLPAEADIAYHGHLPHLTRAQLDGHISQQEIDDILRNVRCYLSTRQHRDSCEKPAMPIATENSMPMSPSQAPLEGSYFDTQTPALREDRFLVTNDEVVGLLDIVIAGMGKFQDDNIQSNCQSLLFPNSTPAKPTLSPRNIILGASNVVDPATTICLPRPCFSWADSVEYRVKASRKSTRDHFRTLHARTISTTITLSKSSPLLATTASKWAKGLLDVTENHERTQHQEAIPDLYHRGVDAHSGVCLHTPLSILEEESRTTPTCPNCSPFLDAYDLSIQGSRDQWPPQTEESDRDHRQKLGRSIGVASHRRIKARESNNQQQDLKENLLDGLRRYSFLPLLDQTTETIRHDHPAPPSWMEIPPEGDKERKLSSQQLLQQILGQSDASSVESSRSKSILGATTTTQPKEGLRKLSRIAAESCSEDTAPHTCLDDQWRSQNFRLASSHVFIRPSSVNFKALAT